MYNIKKLWKNDGLLIKRTIKTLKSNMKLFVYKIILVISIPVFILIVNYLFLHFITLNKLDDINLYNNNNYAWLDNVQKFPKILLLGSSTAQIGLSPNIMTDKLNLSKGEVINLSSSSKSPIQNYYTLKNIKSGILDSVKVIVYGMDKPSVPR